MKRVLILTAVVAAALADGAAHAEPKPDPLALYTGPSARSSNIFSLRPVGNFRFSEGGRTVIEITADGKLMAGPGLSNDEATRRMFDEMSKLWPGLIDQWAAARGWTKPSEAKK